MRFTNDHSGFTNENGLLDRILGAIKDETVKGESCPQFTTI